MLDMSWASPLLNYVDKHAQCMQRAVFIQVVEALSALTLCGKPSSLMCMYVPYVCLYLMLSQHHVEYIVRIHAIMYDSFACDVFWKCHFENIIQHILAFYFFSCVMSLSCFVFFLYLSCILLLLVEIGPKGSFAQRSALL